MEKALKNFERAQRALAESVDKVNMADAAADVAETAAEAVETEIDALHKALYKAERKLKSTKEALAKALKVADAADAMYKAAKRAVALAKKEEEGK